jgi:hypothetical protein
MPTDGYDVALSFAGEQRGYVSQVAKLLRDGGVKVFFDDFERDQLWGKDLAIHFDEVYRKSARFVVPFVSKEYAAKAWPQHEFKSALAKAVEAKEPYILPVRFDDSELPGLRPTLGYVDGRTHTPAQLAAVIFAHLGMPTPEAAAERAPAIRLPKAAPSDFNPYAETERLLSELQSELTKRARELESRGYGVYAQVRNERFMLRIMRGGDNLYGLDVWVGGGWGDNTICFATGTRISGDGTNGTGNVEWDRERGIPIIKIHNMSLLREMGREYRLTANELVEEVWEVACQTIEHST